MTPEEIVLFVKNTDSKTAFFMMNNDEKNEQNTAYLEALIRYCESELKHIAAVLGLEYSDKKMPFDNCEKHYNLIVTKEDGTKTDIDIKVGFKSTYHKITGNLISGGILKINGRKQCPAEQLTRKWLTEIVLIHYILIIKPFSFF